MTIQELLVKRGYWKPWPKGRIYIGDKLVGAINSWHIDFGPTWRTRLINSFRRKLRQEAKTWLKKYRKLKKHAPKS